MQMKRFFIFCMAVFGLFLSSTAHHVDQETAKAIAVKFMRTNDMHHLVTYQTSQGIPTFYIFNSIDGFVIVAADDCETPIIGYSHENQFNPNDAPIQMEEYLQGFVARIQYAIENQLVADEVTAKQWALVKTTGRLTNTKSPKEVPPMITTHWHQGCLYNSLCPEMEHTPCGHAEVGCVAMAMAQIMHYWEFPKFGNGFHSYYSSNGTLSADFGNTTYQYELMPNALSDSSSYEEIEAVATLLCHCGVAVNMNYTDHGSGAYSTDVPYALTHYFKYSGELHKDKPNGDLAGWLVKLKASLDNERPLLYSGQGSSGHAFVCDGYDSNDMLHFNWGWGGNGDGYYALGSLNPLGHNYNNSNAAIFDIIPDNNPHMVSATANPPYGGTIEGTGLYLSDQICTLTAISAENFEFYYWKQNGQIISYDSTYSLCTIEDVDNIEAVFSLKSIHEITAEVTSQDMVNLSWCSHGLNSWPLLKQFNIKNAQSIATNDNYIFLCNSDSQNSIWKFSLEGVYINTWATVVNFPTSLTYDGEFLLCNGNNSAYISLLDMTNFDVVTSIRTGYTPICSYDPIRNGLWIALYDSSKRAYKLKLVDHTGAAIQQGPLLSSEIVPNGSGFFVGDDQDAHLIFKTEEGQVYDYDIDHDFFYRCNADLGTSYGTFICYRVGKAVMYVCYDNDVKLFEISDAIRPWPITHYRLYRADDKGDVTILSDDVTGNNYTDDTWSELGSGLYRFGISSVFGNGNESDIVWSNPIPKGNYNIEENEDSTGKNVQIIFENGWIDIVKDGKRYSITGQTIQ